LRKSKKKPSELVTSSGILEDSESGYHASAILEAPMRTMRATIVIEILLACGFAAFAEPPQMAAQQAPAATDHPKIGPAKEADIRKLQEVRGDKAAVDQIMKDMTDSIRPYVMSTLPPGPYREKFADLFFAKFQAQNGPQKLLDLEVPIYDKYLSDDDLKALIQFYQTPAGHKLAQVTPSISIDLRAASEKWAQETGRQCMVDVISENPDMQKAIEDAEKAGGRP
jgi:uncharacterized protein